MCIISQPLVQSRLADESNLFAHRAPSLGTTLGSALVSGIMQGSPGAAAPQVIHKSAMPQGSPQVPSPLPVITPKPVVPSRPSPQLYTTTTTPLTRVNRQNLLIPTNAG